MTSRKNSFGRISIIIIDLLFNFFVANMCHAIKCAVQFRGDEQDILQMLCIYCFHDLHLTQFLG